MGVKYSDEVYSHKINLNQNALFLDFNYTATLEKVYNIKKRNITYIHNSITNERIILGHGTDPKKFEKEIPLPPDNVDIEDYKHWYSENDNYDYSYDTGRENLYNYFKVMYKPTEEIIKAHSSFFRSLSDISQIYVYGHSISTVDVLYIKKILESVRENCKWQISYYCDDSIEELRNSLLGIGVRDERISFVRLTEIQINNTQLKLDF